MATKTPKKETPTPTPLSDLQERRSLFGEIQLAFLRALKKAFLCVKDVQSSDVSSSTVIKPPSTDDEALALGIKLSLDDVAKLEAIQKHSNDFSSLYTTLGFCGDISTEIYILFMSIIETVKVSKTTTSEIISYEINTSSPKKYDIFCVKTVANGSCGWRTLLTLIIYINCNIIINTDCTDFYKFIVVFKMIFYKFIKKTLCVLDKEKTDKEKTDKFLAGVRYKIHFKTLDEYYSALMNYNYKLTQYEVNIFMLFMNQTIYRQAFQYLSVLILNKDNTITNMLHYLTDDKMSDEYTPPQDLRQYPTILLKTEADDNDHWSCVLPIGNQDNDFTKQQYTIAMHVEL